MSKAKTIKVTLIALLSLAFVQPSSAAGDVEAGAETFRVCGVCHAVGDGARNKVGPVLNGIVGRTAGTFEGYNYSPAMLAAGEAGTIWTVENLTTYLAAPKAFIPGIKMTFPGFQEPSDIDNVVAYLESLPAQ